ncbi:hypothetical protein PXH59_00550 (plasmid) [Xenorhabdus sp. SF857]|uniref:hypothetical protein n=1 Tax=Xenorhabdus bakwenae TaxID=3026967 RepID=UPI0025580DE3|nr:hypothetical protein [Xenorhabdus sp. SF857]WFQ78168.1 hypothetical protein PXH59_00550 [Xenorhabdus sp. SF857]
MTTSQKNSEREDKNKMIVQSAYFQGNSAKNLTRHQFADFCADARRLADNICCEFNLTGKKANGDKFELRIKPQF